jgi:glutathione synthase
MQPKCLAPNDQCATLVFLSGNSIFGDNLRETLICLRKDRSNDIAAYILMQRIFPPASLAYLVREGTFVRDIDVSEFGIFGTCLR